MESQLETILKALYLSSYVVASLALIEFIVVLVSGKRTRQRKETLANFGVWLVNRPLRMFVTGGIFLAILSLIKPFSFFMIPINWLTAGLTLLVADFIYYWNHRISHQVRLLWAYHSVHHSSGEFNLSTAIRLPWIGTTMDTLFYIPAVLLGFDPVMLAISKGLVLLYQYWIHTENVGQLGVFDAVFNSPSNHRVHHGSNSVYLDKNHGGILIIWDKIFNTHQPELEPVTYGLTTPLTTRNPFAINFIEPLNILRDVIGASGLKETFMYIFGPPGWKPVKLDRAVQRNVIDPAAGHNVPC